MAGRTSSEAHWLLVGLRRVNPRFYGGWHGRTGCELCVKDISKLSGCLTRKGVSFCALSDSGATKEAVFREIRAAASRLNSGDVFVFFFAGYGSWFLGRKYYAPGDDDGDKKKFCCYDGQIDNDELRNLWHEFKPGVRIVMLSDSVVSSAAVDLCCGRESNPDMRAILIYIGSPREERTLTSVLRESSIFTEALTNIFNGWKLDGYKGLALELMCGIGSFSDSGAYFPPGQESMVEAFWKERPFAIELSRSLGALPVGGVRSGSAAGGGSPAGAGDSETTALLASTGAFSSRSRSARAEGGGGGAAASSYSSAARGETRSASVGADRRRIPGRRQVRFRREPPPPSRNPDSKCCVIL